MKYTIWIVSPLGYEHSQCFDECATGLRSALVELGHDCRITRVPKDTERRFIVLGAHLLKHVSGPRLPKDSILFNTEQINSRSEFTDSDYIKLLKQFEVWDYSPLNIECLRAHGVEAKLCELGYMPVLESVPKLPEELDVLFIGSVNDRRQKIMNEIAYLGFSTVCLFGQYGWERDRLIARAKIVINIHYYEAKIFEIFRCSYMMANNKCVVSEIGLDKELEDKYNGGIAFCGYGDLVGTVVRLLADDAERKRVADEGYRIFSNLKQTEYLKGLV